MFLKTKSGDGAIVIVYKKGIGGRLNKKSVGLEEGSGFVRLEGGG